jgi:hypothetical protein
MSDSTADGGTRRLPTGVAGALIVLASAGLSLAAARPLGDRVRIRWTVGETYQFGPEHAPTDAVLLAFPLLVALAFVGLVALGRALERAGDLEGSRVYYDLAVLGTLGLVVLFQALLVALNLA